MSASLPQSTRAPQNPPDAAQRDPATIRGMFDAITPSYDRLNRLFSGWLDQSWRRRTAREVTRGLAPCRRVLDVATGTGDLAEALRLELLRGGVGGGIVVGADFTRAMLLRAMRKFREPALHWVEADGQRLPLPDAAFDAATIAFGLRNMADRAAGLRELARVVRPGGRVAVLEFSRPRNHVYRTLYEAYLFHVLPRVGTLLSGSSAYQYLAESIRAFWTPEELTRQMGLSGLREVRAMPLMFGTVYLHVGTRTTESLGDTAEREAALLEARG